MTNLNFMINIRKGESCSSHHSPYGLINTQSLSITMTEGGMYSSRTTDFGDVFN